MRSSLALLRQAGISSDHFRARYGGRSKAGHTIICDVETPAGTEDHVWIPLGHWHGSDLVHNQPIEIIAKIEPYVRSNGREDFGLFDVWVVD